MDVIAAAGAGVLLWSGHVPAVVSRAPEFVPSEPVPPPALPGAERRRSLGSGAVQLGLSVVGVAALAALAEARGAGLGVAAGVLVCALLGPALCFLGIWLTLGLDDRWERRHPQYREWRDALARWQAARYCGRCDAVYWEDGRAALAPREARRLLMPPDPAMRW